MALPVQVKRIPVAEGISTELRYIGVENPIGACILVLPALGVHAAFYDRLLKSLANAGYPAAAVDFRGQGKSSVTASRKENFGYNELLTQDVPSAIAAVTDIFKSKVVILGHSLGGQVGSLYCGIRDERVAGLILCTCCSVYYKSWQGRQKWRVLLMSQFARVYAKLAGYFPGKRFNFGDRTAQRLINDWGHQALTGNYKIAGSSVNWEAGLRNITIPVLALHLQEDFLAPPKAVQHLCNKLGNAALQIHSINQPLLNHFNWAKHPNLFLTEIDKWYKTYLQALGDYSNA